MDNQVVNIVDRGAPVTARKGDWLQTYTGKAYWPLDPRQSEVDIRDIAHALSNLCRYTGHCSRFYSVAEHSLLVSQIVPPEHALIGLLHDATEAYVNDLARPLKRHLPEYLAVEALNWDQVSLHFFGHMRKIPGEVHAADKAILLTEHAELMPHSPLPWRPTISSGALLTVPPDVRIVGFSPVVAEGMFLQRFTQLTAKQSA